MSRKPWPMESLLALLVSLIALACCPAVAIAAPQGSWQTPATDLSESGQDAHNAQVAVAPDGTAHAVWIQSMPDPAVRTASRPPGGSFGAPQTISVSDDSADYPEIAIGDDGTATAVWKRRIDGVYVVQAATRPPGGAFGEPVKLSASGPDVGDVERPQIAFAPDGAAIAIWAAEIGGEWMIQSATRPPGGGFGPPEDLSDASSLASGPQVAVAPDGTAIAVWSIKEGVFDVVQTAIRPPGGTFGPPLRISTAGRNADDPRLAIAPDGATTAVWRQQSLGSSIRTIYSATRPPGGAFGAPVELSEPGGGARQAQIAIGSDGIATVTWRREYDDHAAIQASTRPPGGVFSSPAVDISEIDQDATDPQVAIAPDGTTTVIWQQEGSKNVIQAATRPPGGSFGTPIDLSPLDNDSYAPQIGIAPDGVATAVWERHDGSNVRVQSVSTAAPTNLFTVTRSGDGQGRVMSVPAGIDCGITCSSTYPSYTKVTLTATPASSSTFTGWNGACSGTAPTCEVTMLKAETVNASFTIKPSTPPSSPPSPPTLKPICSQATLKLVRFRAIRKNGTGILKVHAGTAGRVVLQGSKQVRRATKKLNRGGSVTLRARAKGRASKQLKRRGRTRVKVRVIFRPTVSRCKVTAQTKKVRLVKATSRKERSR